ncbi:uncharacterized protein PV07_06463 [Cladophialophora immunda]|uniref:galacturonan 1,4-alpha-galacturonidase n=1 Tax=Cladophialophora immunda TaxID=569365 RepID=A0A0D2CSR1_9EURO|nr:uncharacterized protein PV07_06463 [Cladophialophora immunda]KIW26644.1 hypothetical protein PV07_06463 [Cladophialophora immunda]
MFPKSSILLWIIGFGSLAFGSGSSTIHFPQAATTSIYSPQTTLPYHKNASYPYLGQAPAQAAFPLSPTPSGPKCMVTPLGWGQDDSSQILAAVQRCGINGTITLPAPYVYTISRRMHMNLQNSRLEIFGTLSFTPDLTYWIDNSFRVEFQNQSTGWIVEGNNFEIDGGGWMQGGVNGNGQAWMTHAAGHSNQFGRPIVISIFNSSNVIVTNFSIRQPMFWSFWIQDSYNVEISKVYINGTNTDPYGNSSNYETNIDGLDSLRVDHLLVRDWQFHGGDDCLAPKGNTTNMVINNMTCVGGGIAFGSIGQYVDSPDYIFNVTATNISVSQDINPRTGGAAVSGGAYFKSWVGKEEGEPPQGGGGGTGKVSNVTFAGLTTHNTSQAVYINKCYFKVPDQAHYCDTSTLEFENLLFSDVSGTVSSKVGVALNCSAAAPCSNIDFKDVHLTDSATNATANATCVNAKNITGLTCNATLAV